MATLKKLKLSINFEALLSNQIDEEIDETADELEKAEREYLKNRNKKWMVFGLGLFIGLILGIELPKVANFLNSSKYDRTSLDELTQDYYGHSTIR